VGSQQAPVMAVHGEGTEVQVDPAPPYTPLEPTHCAAVRPSRQPVAVQHDPRMAAHGDGRSAQAVPGLVNVPPIAAHEAGLSGPRQPNVWPQQEPRSWLQGSPRQLEPSPRYSPLRAVHDATVPPALHPSPGTQQAPVSGPHGDGTSEQRVPIPAKAWIGGVQPAGV
jgi:hypothetical protein